MIAIALAVIWYAVVGAFLGLLMLDCAADLSPWKRAGLTALCGALWPAATLLAFCWVLYGFGTASHGRKP